MSISYCPNCGYSRSWHLRRHARRCKQCRKEWTPYRWPVSQVRLSSQQWQIFLRAFLRYKTLKQLRLHLTWSEGRILKLLALTRAVMVDDVPKQLSGVVEVDETYIAGMWHNKRWAVRKRGTKRGRGTSKQAIFGTYERNRKVVRVFLVPNVRKATLMPIMKRVITPGSTIYSDAYQLYQETVKEGYCHDFVDHHQNEWGRGDVNSNGMEGFWGVLKRRLKTTGGIRRERLYLYVAEEVWRYNQRKLSEEQQIKRLFGLLSDRFGGN